MFGDFSTVIVEPKRTREMLFSLKNVELIVSIVHLYLRQKRVHLLVKSGIFEIKIGLLKENIS